MQKQNETTGKALEINLDPKIYGAFAEIGAGQEVARFFFQAGKASQTIAKTISAYDMIYSDEIYGKEKSGRYVCESRLMKMLDKEFSLLHRRLDESRGANTTFFAFANTVATGDQKKRYSHGWMGIRFQNRENGPSNDIVLHIRLLDKHRLQQQETLGVVGVNLVYAAFRGIQDPKDFIPMLVENIKPGKIAIDYIQFKGPDLNHFNNNLMNLELVRRDLADAVLFGPDQSILSVSDTFFKKSVILQRGIFRPVTLTHLDVFKKAAKEFQKDFGDKKPTSVFELTMNSIAPDGNINDQDFLDRVLQLTSLGNYVLVSNFRLFYKLKEFLRQYTDQPIATIVAASALQRIFEEKHYSELSGGLLEGLSKMLDDQSRLYIYPHKSEESCLTAASFNPDSKWQMIYKHFTSLKQIKDIGECQTVDQYHHSQQVADMIKSRKSGWEGLVPQPIVDLIKKQKLFGFYE